MKKIILASQSPRRREILSKMGVEFEAIPSNYDEQLDQNRDVNEVAKELALGKALDVAKRYPDAYVIGSDTIVTIHGKQLEKPVDIDEARSFLTGYCGNKTPVITSIALVNLSKGIQLVDVDTTDVYFKSDNKEVSAAREAYLATGDWADKAGGYGIQSGVAPLVDHIEGDYETIIGLPTRHLSKMLVEVGIESSIVVEKPPIPQKEKSTKIIKFRDYLVPLVLSGQKTSTWRLFDVKNLSLGDTIELHEFGKEGTFATGHITKIVEKPFKELTVEDKKGHGEYQNDAEMFKAFSGYYNTEVTSETTVKIIWFELTPKLH